VGWSRRQLKEQKVLETFQERISITVGLALHFQVAIGEDVTSGDMKTQIVLSDAEFNPRMMEDEFSQDRGGFRTGRVRVAGTTGIGLQRSVKGSSPLVLSKPKVVLCSALE